MSREYEQIPESFIRDLEQDRRNLVRLLKKTKAIDLDLFSRDTYPDDAHLLFELLQNAEDTGATAACFKLDTTKLSFTHDGRPFSREDVLGIIRYGSDGEDPDKIGRFGIGFKSVYAYSETPRIYSDTVAFKIVDRIVPRTIDRPARHSTGETLIELPLDGQMKPIEDVRGEIRQGLQEMSAMSILHLRNIRSIDWCTDDGRSGSIRRAELDERVVQIDAMRPGDTERRFFLRFREPYAERPSMHLDVAFELDEKEWEQDALVESDEALSDRFRIVPAEHGSVAVFFPAVKETSKLRFHLHAPFITPTDRASVKEHADNDVLFGRLARLVAKSLAVIRDLGLLDREFLGVLPNSKDALLEAYEPFRKAVVQTMADEPLVPMQGGGHGRATHLLQGRGEFKDFLGVGDIRFLVSGWDYDARYMYLGRWAPKIHRSGKSSPNRRGWAVSATRRNTEVDHFLNDLAIHQFKVEHLVPPDSRSDEEIEEWLATHDAAWHRAYYASVDKHWDALRPAHDRLRKLPMARTRPGTYRRAAECCFANDGEVPKGVTIADPDTYASGTSAKRAKAGLSRLGVQEIDDEDRVVGILEAYYVESDQRPPWDIHRDHVKSFIDLVSSGRVTEKVFDKYRLLLNSANDWVRPSELYAGSEYPDATAAAYYQLLHDLQESATRCQIQSRYRDIPRFDNFAKGIGVAYTIPVSETKCESNPQWEYLQSGGGLSRTGYEINSDWHIPCLERVLEQAMDQDTEREGLARAIWTALRKSEGESLKAVFRRNAHASTRRHSSQLVFTLRKYAWVPQEQDGGGSSSSNPARPDRTGYPAGSSLLRAGHGSRPSSSVKKDMRRRGGMAQRSLLRRTRPSNGMPWQSPWGSRTARRLRKVSGSRACLRKNGARSGKGVAGSLPHSPTSTEPGIPSAAAGERRSGRRRLQPERRYVRNGASLKEKLG